MVFVGEEVVIKGTGRRWAGVNYNVTVVDLRDDDGSVKVRYSTDGGYKRFSKEEFNNLLVQEAHPYKFAAYELFDDVYDPTVEVISQADALREELYAAVKAKDFKKAAQIKSDLKAKFEASEAISSAKARLIVAVQQEDFEAADKIQAELTSLATNGAKQEAPTEQAPTGEVDFGAVVAKAKARAFSGGISGAAAMLIQVTSLMWMRTTMNYQYRYGTSTREAMKALYAEGGIRRFYKGIGPGLFQGPLSRFGDTAANTGMLAFLNAMPQTATLPVGVKTVAASTAAASFRILLMPIDALKTNLQVDGNLSGLMKKVKANGIFAFWHGSLAACSATFAGHLPWFGTYNFLNSRIPEYEGKMATLARNAGMGFCSSVVSDTVSNSIRVVKTYRQTSNEPVSYIQSAKNIIASDGVVGLFGRGLKTRILANGTQGVMFSVLWKYFDKYVFNKSE